MAFASTIERKYRKYRHTVLQARRVIITHVIGSLMQKNWKRKAITVITCIWLPVGCNLSSHTHAKKSFFGCFLHFIESKWGKSTSCVRGTKQWFAFQRFLNLNAWEERHLEAGLTQNPYISSFLTQGSCKNVARMIDEQPSSPNDETVICQISMTLTIFLA